MQLSTQIIRTPFGASETTIAAEWYDGDPWEQIKEKAGVLHRQRVSEWISNLPGSLLGVTSGYLDGVTESGRRAEWWSVIAYNGDPL